MQTTEITEQDIGVWLDSHRGHYMSRDIIQLAQGYGFIVGPSEQWVIDTYENFSHYEDYPQEAVYELADEVINWLNSGRGECRECDGRGNVPMILPDNGGATSAICRTCSGTGRGDRIAGQNFPPKLPEVPDGYYLNWSTEDGDFGLWVVDSEGEIVDDWRETFAEHDPRQHP